MVYNWTKETGLTILGRSSLRLQAINIQLGCGGGGEAMVAIFCTHIWIGRKLCGFSTDLIPVAGKL